MARFPQAQPVNVEDFSGGITDQIVTNDVTKAEEMDNLIVTDNKKAKGRDGSDTFPTGTALVPIAAEGGTGDILATATPAGKRIGGLKEFKENSTLIVQAGPKVYANDGTAWTELQGPNSKDGLPQAADDFDANLSASEWRGHMFITNDGDTQPAKIYKDENGDLNLLGAGLPPVAETENYETTTNADGTTDLAQLLVIANDIKLQFNNHRASTELHNSSTESSAVSSADATDFSTLATLAADIRDEWQLHLDDAGAGSPVDHYGISPLSFSTDVSAFPVSTESEIKQLLITIKRDFIFHGMEMSEDGATGGSTAHRDGSIFTIQSRFSLLDECIQMVNEARALLLVHMNENVFQHLVVDTVSIGLIGAEATDEDSLFRLTGELLDAYSNHFRDVTSLSTLHDRVTVSNISIIIQSTEADQELIFSQTPTTLEGCADALNDLKVKFNTHEVNVYIHKGKTDSGAGLQHRLIWNDSIKATTGPTTEPSVDAFSNYFAGIAKVYNLHVDESFTATQHLGSSPALTRLNTDNTQATSPVDDKTLAHAVDDIVTRFSREQNVTSPVGSHAGDQLATTPVMHISNDTNDNRLDQYVDVGFSGTTRFAGGIVPGAYSTIVDRLNELKSKVVSHIADTPAHSVSFQQTIPLPDISVSTYSYAFHYFREYKVGADIVFQDFGPTTVKVFDNLVDPNFGPVVLENITALAEGARDNLDLTNIKLRIYRTVANGNTFYKVGEIASTETSFTDRTDDENLILQETIYTTGGVLSNDRPPESKYLHIVNDYCYYANIVLNGEGEDGENVGIPHRILQSKVGDPDSTPRGNFVDLDEPVVGIGSFNDRPIAFTASSVFRLDGTFDEAGNGFISAVKISDDVGLASNRSLVRVDQGLLFAGSKDGFYITNGLEVRKISDFEDRYTALNDKSNIVGVFDEKNRRVSWATKKTSSSTDNDQLFVLHLNFPFRNQSATFTTASGGSSFSPSALGYFANQVVRGNSNGFLFRHDNTFRTDPVIETTTAPTDWVDETIIWNYKGIATNFGMENSRKWVPFMTMKFKRQSRLALLPRSYNDLGAQVKDMAPVILHGPEFIWNEATTSDFQFIWGDSDFIWDHIEGTVGTFKRRFTSPQIRCDNKQMQFTNANALILSSASSQTATIYSAAKTLTLAADPAIPWPLEFEGYSVAFSVDGFVTDFPITAISGDQLTLTYSDADDQTVQNYPTAALTSWVVRGEQKGDILELLGYSIYYVPFSNTQMQYQGSPQGGAFDSQAS